MNKCMTACGQLSRMASFVTAVVLSSSVFAQPIVTQSTIDSTSRNYNYNYNTSTSENNNYNKNDSNSYSKSDSNNNSNSTANSTTTVKSPPPTAIAPSITSINNDLCTVGASGAVQTQILGLSFGAPTTDKNCERLKLASRL